MTRALGTRVAGGPFRGASGQPRHRRLTPGEDWPACPAPTEGNWRQTVEALKAGNAKLRQAVRGFPAERLEDPLVLDVLYTAYTQFIGVTQHQLYHAGQIALLKRAPAQPR